MQLIKPVHPETHEILNNLQAAYQAGEVTTEQRNDVVLSCFRAEIESEVLGAYPEAGQVVEIEASRMDATMEAK